MEPLLSPNSESSAGGKSPGASVDRTLWTLGLYAAVGGIGISYAMLGPTLLDLTERLECSQSLAALLFSARAGGYLLGATVGGPMVDKSPNPARLLFFGTAGSAVGAASVPFIRHLTLAYTSQALQGVCMGLLDTGGNVLMLTVWRGSRYVNAAVHGFHFLFGLGAFIAPLVVGLALSYERPAVEAWFSPVAGFLPALLTLALLVSHVQPNTDTEDGGTKALPKVVLWTGAFLLSYVGLEVAFGGYVDAFAVRHLLVSKVAAASLTSIYWAALSAARLVATLVTPYVNHYRYIQLHLLGAFLSMAAFAQSSWEPQRGLSGEVVLFTFLYGFSLGPLFPGALLVAEEKLHPEPLNGRAAGFTVACAALGEMLLPLLTGLCFDVEVTSFAFVQLAICCGSLLFFALV